MHVAVDSTEMRAVLTLMKKVVCRKNTLPILSNVLLDASEGRLRVCATDLEVALSMDVESARVTTPGVITIPARELLDWFRGVSPHTEVVLNTDGRAVHMLCRQTAGKLYGLPDDEFPKIARVPETPKAKFTLPAAVMRRMLTTRMAASAGETQYFLNGVYLHICPDSIRFVATDSHRLALQQLAAKSAEGKDFGVIIPSTAAEMLDDVLRQKSEVGGAVTTIFPAHSENQLLFKTSNGTVISTRLVDGEYPAYRQIIPKEHPHIAVFDSDELRSAVEQAALCANPKTRRIHLDIHKTEAIVSAESPDKGRAEATVACKASEPIGMGFDASYLVDGIRFVGGHEITLTYKEPINPALLTSGTDVGSLYLVMPMRIE